jgi:CHAT domain-containing protein
VIDVSAQVQAATAELTSIWEQISAYPGGHQYVAARRGSSSWAEIRQWVDSQPAGFALLEYAVLFDRVAAFVVRPGRPEPTVVEIPLTQSALSQSYLALIREMDGSAAGRIRRETWDRTAAPLVTRVLPELRGTRLLCLVPHLLLHAMPLHALGEPGSTLLDQMAVYYAQSATLAAQLGRAPRRLRLDGGRPDALVVGDTLGDLAHAREEAVEVGRLLGVDPLTGEQATLAAVLPRLAQVELAHLACHGQLNTDVPALSSVVLADGLLTANQIQESGALRCDVLILSGCDTGYQPLQRTLEVGGLPSALLAAGARTAVGALWPVNDEATKELFILFFREFAGAGSAPGDTRDEVARSVPWCLRAAALALRQQRPERYFWAPFIAVGSW